MAVNQRTALALGRTPPRSRPRPDRARPRRVSWLRRPCGGRLRRREVGFAGIGGMRGLRLCPGGGSHPTARPGQAHGSCACAARDESDSVRATETFFINGVVHLSNLIKLL